MERRRRIVLDWLRGASRGPRGRAPQEVDVDDLGGPGWREPIVGRVDGFEVWLPRAVHAPPALRPAPRRRLGALVALAALAALAVVLFLALGEGDWDDLGAADRSRTEALLSAEAGRIAGRPARVRCDAEGKAVGIVQHADGLAEVGGTNAYLTPAICFRLYRLGLRGDEGPFSGTARALAVLAHEAWHLRGVADEGVVNCYAFQSGVALGRRLGLAEGTAARMMRQQLAENAIQARSAPAYLVPGECRDGGRLDLDAETERFP